MVKLSNTERGGKGEKIVEMHLNLLPSGNSLRSIHKHLHSIYLVLDLISNLEMI